MAASAAALCNIKGMEGCTVVCWPEIQYLMGQRGFGDNATLIVAGPDYEKYGDSAYYVDDIWLNGLSKELRRMIGL